jgi:hypothetical protein
MEQQIPRNLNSNNNVFPKCPIVENFLEYEVNNMLRVFKEK